VQNVQDSLRECLAVAVVLCGERAIPDVGERGSLDALNGRVRIGRRRVALGRTADGFGNALREGFEIEWHQYPAVWDCIVQWYVMMSFVVGSTAAPAALVTSIVIWPLVATVSVKIWTSQAPAAEYAAC